MGKHALERRTRTHEDTVACLQQRTLAAINEAWKLEKQLPELESKVEKLTRQSASDVETIEKGVLMRNKLQDLCRELQKQNREVRPPSIHRLSAKATNSFRSII